MQRAFVEWMDGQKRAGVDIKFTSIPNSTFTTSYQAKTANILSGLRRGLPDLFIIINDVPLFIEMKSERGVLSEHQKKWIDAINQTVGVKAYVCYGTDEAIDVIKSFL